VSAMALVAMTKTTMPWSVKSTVSIGGLPTYVGYRTNEDP
jgi:hypothetical protein